MEGLVQLVIEVAHSSFPITTSDVLSYVFHAVSFAPSSAFQATCA